MRGAAICAAALGAAVLAGCGSSGDSSSSSASAAAGGPPPASLVGTYGTTLQASDLPANPPPELTDGSKSWTVKIAKTGGPGGSPTLTIANDQAGVLESPKLAVAGKTIYLPKEECANNAGSDVLFNNARYTWALNGKTLTLSDPKDVCPDKVAVTILTAHPLTKESG
jgi:hypothetical protein